MKDEVANINKDPINLRKLVLEYINDLLFA